MSEPDGQNTTANVEETLARMEQRLARVEMMLGLDQAPEDEPGVMVKSLRGDGEFELAVGQNLFAKVGIMVLAIGMALALSLPWQGLPAALPSGIGWVLAGGLFLSARLLQRSMPLNARYFRGAGMGLLFFATLRLCYFGGQTVFEPASVAGALALSLAVVVNLGVGWWRKSVYLTGLAMLTGYGAALAVGTPCYVLGTVTVMTLAAGVAARKRDWPWLVVFATPCAFVTYLLWAIGNPVVGNQLEVVSGPFAGVCLLLAWMAMNGVAMTWRRDRATEEPLVEVGSVLNCGGYVLFLLHTFIRFRDVFTSPTSRRRWYCLRSR